MFIRVNSWLSCSRPSSIKRLHQRPHHQIPAIHQDEQQDLEPVSYTHLDVYKRQRLTFVKAVQEGEEFFAELCREYGISRKTGYKWRKRYESGGVTSLADQSRAPHQQARATSQQLTQAILGARSDHHRWGPGKLRAWLQRRQPDQAWPAISTFGEILKRAGLTAPRPKRLWVAPTPGTLQPADAANAVWCADFKGYFHCQDGSRCDPLTVTDAYSRYLLRCQAVDGLDEKYARALFVAAFREYGMPHTIRTDNGSPFASVALAGLSALSVWWIKLGIWPERCLLYTSRCV